MLMVKEITSIRINLIKIYRFIDKEKFNYKDLPLFYTKTPILYLVQSMFIFFEGKPKIVGPRNGFLKKSQNLLFLP